MPATLGKPRSGIGERAEWVGHNNYAEALGHWRCARQLLDKLPETSENINERASVRAQIMTPLARLGDPEDQATSLFREARALAARSADVHVLAQVLYGFGSIRLFAGAVDERSIRFSNPFSEPTRRKTRP
jgi:hypothetical protein